jgi:predicted phage-related endonuclease
MPVIISTPIQSEQHWHEMRAPNVGCSEVAALLGIHPYLTGYGLAARKLGKIPAQPDNPAMKRGRLLEPIVKQLLSEDRPDWKQIPVSNYYEDSAARWGCTPDLFVQSENGIGLIQIKTVTPHEFAHNWHNEAGAVEPPLWIAVQTMGEQHLTGADWAYVAALVIGHGLQIELVQVPFIPDLINQLRQRIAEFWAIVDAGQLPDPDYGHDRETLAAVLRHDDGTELDLSADNELPDIVDQMEALKMARKTAEDGYKEAQARILHRIGNAKTVRFAGGIIQAPTIHRKEYTTTVAANDYRRITVKMDRHAERRRA